MVRAHDIVFKNELEGFGITMYRQGDALFDAPVEEIFNAGDKEKVADLLPYAVLIRNGTGKHLLAVSVQYAFESPIAPGTIVRNRVSPNASVADRSLMLKPGEYIFVTPVGDVGGILDKDGRRQRYPIITDNTLKSMAGPIWLYRGRVVTVSIDCFVDEAGFLFGPDEAGFERDMRARRQAEIEVYSATLSLRGAKLKEYLAGLAASTGDDRDPYVRYFRSRAEALLDELDQVGEDRAIATIRDREKQVETFPSIMRRLP